MPNQVQAAARRRRGFTLIELLVVTAIVIIGMALAVPAVQQSRAQARQATCKNNLKQHGLALHNYHDTYKTFPPGWNAHVPTAGNSPRFGWQTSILPYMDQFPLFKSIARMNNGKVFEGNMPAADFGPLYMKQKILQTSIQVYRCPADSTSDTNPMRGDYGTSNYSGNHGNVPLPRWAAGRRTAFWPGQADTPREANGVMYWNSSVGFRDITDGMSNTFLVGERSVTSAAGIWPGVGSNEFENDVVTECSHGSRLNKGPTSFSSGHEGGANFLFGDGRVQFINNDIDSKSLDSDELGTYQRLANRDDRMPVGEY